MAIPPSGASSGTPGDPGSPDHMPGPSPTIRLSMRILEHTQDFVSAVTGAALILLSGALLIAGVVDFIRRLSTTPLTNNATDLLDQVLLVLILVEIVHTVVLSLRAHTLVPQPFIVVGLVAVIRKLLFVLGNQQTIPTTVLALYIAMVAVFVAALVAVNRLTGRQSGGRDLP